MKKIISLILALVMCLSLCACSGNSTNSTEQKNDEPEETVSTPTESEETASVQTTPEDIETQDSTESVSPVEVVEVLVGGTLSTEFVEMTFNEVTVAKDIKHSVTTGHVTRITGPEPVDGQQYICLTGIIKNISTNPLPVYDFFVGNFNLDGYSYTVDANDCDILDGEGQSRTEIDPLMEYTFRIYVAIPDSLADSYSSCTFTFGFHDLFDNTDLSYNRAFEDDPIVLCPYQFIVPIK